MLLFIKKINAKSRGSMVFKMVWSLLFSVMFPILIYYLLIGIIPKEPTEGAPFEIVLQVIYYIHRLVYYSTIQLFGTPQNISSITFQALYIFIILYGFARKYVGGLILSIVDIVIVIIVYYMFEPNVTLTITFDIPAIDAAISLSLLPIYIFIMIGVIAMNSLEILVYLYELQHKDCYYTSFYNENDFITESDLNKSRVLNEELKTIRELKDSDLYCSDPKNKTNKYCTTYNIIKNQYKLPNTDEKINTNLTARSDTKIVNTK